MANRHRSRRCTPQSTRETQIKTTARCHLPPVRTAVVRKIRDRKRRWGCGGRAPRSRVVGVSLGAATMENSTEVPQTKASSTTRPGSHTSGYASKENENTNWKRYTHPYIQAASFTITKIWKQPKRPPTDKGTEKLWYKSTVKQ